MAGPTTTSLDLCQPKDELGRLVGRTPLVHGASLLGTGADVRFKLEKCNPCGSVKDRAAAYIIESAERRGDLCEGGTIIESSSGNLGIALAWLGAMKGYRVIVIVDPKASSDNLDIMSAYGAEVIVEDRRDETGNYHRTRIERAAELNRSITGSYWVNQTNNRDNVAAHRWGLGQEIVDECGDLDFCVLAVSSGGQVSGVAEALSELRRAPRVVAVDIDGSAIFDTGHPYSTPGLGLSWTPSILREDLIDDVFLVGDPGCWGMARFLAGRGLLVGPSSGAVALVCWILAAQHPDARLVGVLPDGGERYVGLPAWRKDRVGSPAQLQGFVRRQRRPADR